MARYLEEVSRNASLQSTTVGSTQFVAPPVVAWGSQPQNMLPNDNAASGASSVLAALGALTQVCFCSYTKETTG